MTELLRAQVINLARHFDRHGYAVREQVAELLVDIGGQYGAGYADGSLLRSHWSMSRRARAN